jgi:hypothetical protein
MKGKLAQSLLLLATVCIGAMALSQNQGFIPQKAPDPGSRASNQFRNSAVRILVPRSGQSLANNFVTLRFELVRPNPAGGENNFVVQLDGREPINTSGTEYTFTGMHPGPHTISVSEVDANGTPLPDARSEVQFNVKPPEGTAAPAKSDSKAGPGK